MKKKLPSLLIIFIGLILPFAANILGGFINGFSPGQYIFAYGKWSVNIGALLFIIGGDSIPTIHESPRRASRGTP